ncbi:MAG TPA: serine/threonine-protein kinase [Polyangiaceae bacterium]|nr:serine/threonine-protein kinase [Polyangiaceae bacterium]
MTQATNPTSSAVRRRARSGDSPHSLASAASGSAEFSLPPRGDVSPLLTAAALALFAAGSIVSLMAADAGLWLSLTGLSGAAALMLAVAPTRRSQLVSDDGARPTRLGPYTLGEKLGEGGMGVVYKARHAFLERPTAIKLLRPNHDGAEAVRRFEREVQLTSQLTHPNTISIYDFGRTSEGACYYAMEYVDGLDLQKLVEREGPQDPERVAHLLAQLCGALAEAHGAGLIHRDIKPANLMLCERGGAKDVLKVLDFGLIKHFDDQNHLTHSEVQSVVGTPLYLSPEALIAPDTMDGRSDLYAVGVVGYFLLTGEPPFTGSGLLEVCAHHLHSTPVPPSQRLGRRIPAQLEALILSCLHKAKENRPASAAEVREALLPLATSWGRPRVARLRAANG